VLGSRRSRGAGAAPTWAVRRASHRRPWQAGAVASLERHGDVRGSLQSRPVGCGTHVCRPAHSPADGHGRRGRLRRTNGTGTCCDREAPDAALAWAARHGVAHSHPPAVAGGGGRVARAARGRAGLAAIARRRMRYKRGPPCAHPAADRGRRDRSRHRRGSGTCSARCDRDAPGAAHTWAGRRAVRRRP
jgi:hypothetical protein